MCTFSIANLWPLSFSFFIKLIGQDPSPLLPNYETFSEK